MFCRHYQLSHQSLGATAAPIVRQWFEADDSYKPVRQAHNQFDHAQESAQSITQIVVGRQRFQGECTQVGGTLGMLKNGGCRY